MKSHEPQIKTMNDYHGRTDRILAGVEHPSAHPVGNKCFPRTITAGSSAGINRADGSSPLLGSELQWKQTRQQLNPNQMKFTRDQVRALCGGTFPLADGFAWDQVEHFRLEDGVLQPYDESDILPGPALAVSAQEAASLFQ